jgi:exodeoxyribonuclease V alpha subunit
MRVLDQEFAQWVRRGFCQDCDEEQAESVEQLAMAVSHALNLKHSCLDLNRYPALQDPLLNEFLAGVDPEWVRNLTGGAVGQENSASKPVPLVCSADGSLVWLQKYHGFEHGVAGMVRDRARDRTELSQDQKESLDVLYPDKEFGEQRKAVETALSSRFSIITGGPGTGKTWTVARIIAVMIKQGLEDGRKPRIALAAPTGKAAARMLESLHQAATNEQIGQLIRAGELPDKAQTLHSLLGISRRSPRPRHDAANPLAVDVLIVDEASMVDLPMMYRLLNACPADARLILLGDKDQLASVEAGSVLGELCNPHSAHYEALRSSIAVINRSYRYQESPEIGALATAINAVRPLPDFGHNKHVTRSELKSGDDPWSPGWLDKASQRYASLAALIGEGRKAKDILRQQMDFQILCALRNGPAGVSGINAMLASALGKRPGDWYAGLPVMVTVNDHDRKLFNGDVGLVLPVRSDGDQWLIDEGAGKLKACFFTGDGAVKAVSLAQMPGFDTCYAITVHKSQGSEYEKILFVLPASAEQVENNPVITRELLYTGVTRARKEVEIWCGRGVLEAAARQETIRMSGLGHQLVQ